MAIRRSPVASRPSPVARARANRKPQASRAKCQSPVAKASRQSPEPVAECQSPVALRQSPEPVPVASSQSPEQRPVANHQSPEPVASRPSPVTHPTCGSETPKQFSWVHIPASRPSGPSQPRTQRDRRPTPAQRASQSEEQGHGQVTLRRERHNQGDPRQRACLRTTTLSVHKHAEAAKGPRGPPVQPTPTRAATAKAILTRPIARKPDGGHSGHHGRPEQARLLTMHAKRRTGQQVTVNNARPLPSRRRAGHIMRQAISGQVVPVASTGRIPKSGTTLGSPGAATTSQRCKPHSRTKSQPF